MNMAPAFFSTFGHIDLRLAIEQEDVKSTTDCDTVCCWEENVTDNLAI
jgi:hypothetical protein